MAKRYIACIAALAVVAMVACDDSPESGRTIVNVLNFNGGAPVQSDVLFDNFTDPPYVPEDLIPATFTSRFYNGFITGANHSEVVIERYHVDWTRTDGGSGALPSRDEASHIVVVIGDETDALIRLTTWEDKSGPILAPLVGTANQVSMRADITFFARETGTTEEIQFKASISVNFADTVNE